MSEMTEGMEETPAVVFQDTSPSQILNDVYISSGMHAVISNVNQRNPSFLLRLPFEWCRRRAFFISPRVVCSEYGIRPA